VINFIPWYLFSTIKVESGAIPPPLKDDLLYMNGENMLYMDNSKIEYMRRG
jgi:hypothetical protein